MTDDVDRYIRANRDRYTREAITRQLMDAGHSPETIDAAWQRAEADGDRPGDRGWRPGWAMFLVLAILGSAGAALVWMEEPYAGGGLAVVIYLSLVGIGYGLGKALSLLVDRGHQVVAALPLALLAVGGASLAFLSGLPAVALAIALLAGVPALLLLWTRSDRRVAGMVGASLPILMWLAVTGTCYAPLLDRVLRGGGT